MSTLLYRGFVLGLIISLEANPAWAQALSAGPVKSSPTSALFTSMAMANRCVSVRDFVHGPRVFSLWTTRIQRSPKPVKQQEEEEESALVLERRRFLTGLTALVGNPLPPSVVAAAANLPAEALHANWTPETFNIISAITTTLAASKESLAAMAGNPKTHYRRQREKIPLGSLARTLSTQWPEALRLLRSSGGGSALLADWVELECGNYLTQIKALAQKVNPSDPWAVEVFSLAQAAVESPALYGSREFLGATTLVLRQNGIEIPAEAFDSAVEEMTRTTRPDTAFFYTESWEERWLGPLIDRGISAETGLYPRAEIPLDSIATSRAKLLDELRFSIYESYKPESSPERLLTPERLNQRIAGAAQTLMEDMFGRARSLHNADLWKMGIKNFYQLPGDARMEDWLRDPEAFMRHRYREALEDHLAYQIKAKWAALKRADFWIPEREQALREGLKSQSVDQLERALHAPDQFIQQVQNGLQSFQGNPTEAMRWLKQGDYGDLPEPAKPDFSRRTLPAASQPRPPTVFVSAVQDLSNRLSVLSSKGPVDLTVTVDDLGRVFLIRASGADGEKLVIKGSRELAGLRYDLWPGDKYDPKPLPAQSADSYFLGIPRQSTPDQIARALRRFPNSRSWFRLDARGPGQPMPPIQEKTAARLRLERALQAYINRLSVSDTLPAEGPDAFLLLGNPDLKVFVDFVAAWKRYSRPIPIVIAGGWGRGTVPLIAKVLEDYGSHFPSDTRERLRQAQDESSGVTEAELLNHLLVSLGIPQAWIRLESSPSHNTKFNFLNSEEVMAGLFAEEGQGHRPRTIAVVTSPDLLLRSYQTGLKQWAGHPHWTLKRAPAYAPQVSELSDQDLVDRAGYRAGYPLRYKQKFGDLNIFNEFRGITRPNVNDAVPLELSEKEAALLTDTQVALEDFLNETPFTYDAVAKRLILQPALETFRSAGFNSTWVMGPLLTAIATLILGRLGLPMTWPWWLATYVGVKAALLISVLLHERAHLKADAQLMGLSWRGQWARVRATLHQESLLKAFVLGTDITHAYMDSPRLGHFILQLPRSELRLELTHILGKAAIVLHGWIILSALPFLVSGGLLWTLASGTPWMEGTGQMLTLASLVVVLSNLGLLAINYLFGTDFVAAYKPKDFRGTRFNGPVTRNFRLSA